MTSYLNPDHASEIGVKPNSVAAKPMMSAEDLEDMRAVVAGQKEQGGTPWSDVKALLDL